MVKYLGEVDVTPDVVNGFAAYNPSDWAMRWIEMYGGIDGDHHKAWVLDQVSRILKGTPVIITQASWDNGVMEYRFNTGEPSPAYLAWVEEMRGAYDEDEEEYEYSYEIGIAP